MIYHIIHMIYVIVVLSKVMFLVIFSRYQYCFDVLLFYSFSFVYILYSTAVIWRINFIICALSNDDVLNDLDEPLTGFPRSQHF